MTELSPRQLEVLRLMPTMSGKEIAKELGISFQTVRNTQSAIYMKFEIIDNNNRYKRNRAVLKGIRLGLIDLEVT